MSAIRARAGRWLLEHRGAIAILLYHRVARLESDPQQLAVDPERFDAQLTALRATCTPVALVDVPGLLRARRLPKRPVAVTFDDGYRDNLVTAKPLLERHGVPATVFVASGYVGSGREFWWDELERLGSPDLHAKLKHAPAAGRERMLDQLREQGDGQPDPKNLSVDHDELRQLDGGAVTVGSHTRNHLSLAAHPAYVQRDEIRGGIEELSGWLERRVDLFAYPFGTPGVDVSGETRRIAKEAGVRAAAVNDPRLCTVTASRYSLPRFLVRDWTGERFADWLEREVFAW
jgi:peptidoglycan/xylan/chitin deacetylase (PgdA/CDA1 family)